MLTSVTHKFKFPVAQVTCLKKTKASMFPNLAPSSDTMKLGQAADTPALWAVFCKQYKAEMATPCARHDLALLAALSHTTNLSVGCYCEQASRCHRSILQELLVNCGAKLR